jgi:hypothetical protein
MASLVTPYPLGRIKDAFQDLMDRREGLYKVALTPS